MIWHSSIFALELNRACPALSAELLLIFFSRQSHRVLLGFTDEARQALQSYEWPGNVRELRNAVERAVLLCRTDRVGIELLPFKQTKMEAPPSIGDLVSLETVEEMHIRRVLSATRSIEEACRVLGMDSVTLWRRRKKYAI